MDFINAQVPTRFKESKQLISHDMKNNTFNQKYTISMDIAPVCKDDLVVLPAKLSKELGGLGPLVLVYKISTFVQVVDVFTMRTYEIAQNDYWKHKFTALCGRDRLSEFIVLNIDSVDHDVNVSRAAAKQRFKMVTVEVVRVADFGRNDKTFIVNTHLGETLNYNDTVLGFDLDAINLMQLDDLDHEI
jgi:nonsense-mediated mRNA decay protein 3